MAECCANCKYSLLAKMGTGTSIFCRRNPPTIVDINPEGAKTMFPVVGGNSWCGEFKEKGVVIVKNVQERNGNIVAIGA